MVWDVITTRIHESGQFLFEGSWHDFDVKILDHGIVDE